ncbi:MAG: hypothetical protein WC284_03785 [Candidimonas sp.]
MIENFIENEQQTIIVDGITYPIHDSENSLIASSEKEQTKFWKWFRNSKVVDQYGRPLVLYRGDIVGKNKFTGKENKTSRIQGNIFFTNTKYVAKGYTTHRTNSYISSNEMNHSHGLYSVYLKIQNPLTINAKGEDWSRIPLSGLLKKKIGWNSIQIDELALYIQENTSNDGLIVKDVWDQFGDGDQYVVFSSDQIKIKY